MIGTSLLLICAGSILLGQPMEAFAPLSRFSSSASASRAIFPTTLSRHVPTTSSTSTSSLYAAAGKAVPPQVPNLFQKLPWNVRKEKERQARRLKLERAALHRQLGIAEDATYEEIVAATDRLIAMASGDLKKKVQIEVAKDKILQIRLNERLAGLNIETKEARAQSNREREGAMDEDDVKANKAANKEWTGPAWAQGLVVKPDETHLKSQIRIWGIITLVGAIFPPAQEYLGRFTWLVCVAQLTYRGMPKEAMDRGGMGFAMSSSSGKGGHRKVAFALGLSIWIAGAILVYTAIPKWARGHRWSGTLTYTLQNLIFAVACSYLQPYKGGRKIVSDDD